jgi:hypothetical protein
MTKKNKRLVWFKEASGEWSAVRTLSNDTDLKALIFYEYRDCHFWFVKQAGHCGHRVSGTTGTLTEAKRAAGKALRSEAATIEKVLKALSERLRGKVGVVEAGQAVIETNKPLTPQEVTSVVAGIRRHWIYGTDLNGNPHTRKS